MYNAYCTIYIDIISEEFRYKLVRGTELFQRGNLSILDISEENFREINCGHVDIYVFSADLNLIFRFFKKLFKLHFLKVLPQAHL